MTADHAARAVELTEQAEDPDFGAERPLMLASAQVHAILALAEAVGRLGVQRPRWDDDLREANLKALTEEAWGKTPDHPEIVTERGQERPNGAETDLRRVTGQRDRLREGIQRLISQEGPNLSCGGYRVTDEGCYVSDLAARLQALLADDPTHTHPITVAGQPAEERGKP